MLDMQYTGRKTSFLVKYIPKFLIIINTQMLPHAHNHIRDSEESYIKSRWDSVQVSA